MPVLEILIRLFNFKFNFVDMKFNFYSKVRFIFIILFN